MAPFLTADKIPHAPRDPSDWTTPANPAGRKLDELASRTDFMLAPSAGTLIGAALGTTTVTFLTTAQAMANLRIPIPAYKTADTVINNDNSINNDPHLAVTLPIGRYWVVLGGCRILGTTAADFIHDFTFSGTATFHFGSDTMQVGTNSTVTTRVITAFSTTVFVGLTTGTTFRLLVQGGIDVTVAGTLQWRWSQNTAEVSDLTVYQHAFLTAFPTA
jgi:hypothetical protein